MLRVKDVTMRVFLAILALTATLFVFDNSAPAQSQTTGDAHDLTVRGRVLNAATGEPITRAMVNIPGTNAAAFTDDRGQFELKIRTQQTGNSGNGGTLVTRVGGGFVEARKLGFLQEERMPTSLPSSPANQSSEVLIRLLPEAKIVGRITVPGSDGDVRIESQLFRREMNAGRETWMPQRTFISWVDGEIRFSGLRPGTYKLITHEEMDRELLATPGAQLYGYPPVYYSNTTDFSLATPIVVKAGETARVSLSVARKEYYPVRIPVESMASGHRLNVTVYPTGHPSPGWSLGYDPREGAITGLLPDGNYSVEANTAGEGELTGTLNFSVKGKALEGPSLNLLPDAIVEVRVREEFQSSPSNFTTQEAVAENAQRVSRRYSNVSVSLISLDDFNTPNHGLTSRLPEGSSGQELTIPDVRPGRYQVQVYSGSGYPFSVQSGGKDLTRQPLVVGFGGEVPPIEVVLRDNGAQLNGTLDEDAPSTPSVDGSVTTPPRFVYLLPMSEGGQPRNTQAWQGAFRFDQIAPGAYLVLAFDRPRQDLPSGPGEAVQRLASRGQVIQVEPAQQLNVRVKVTMSDSE